MVDIKSGALGVHDTLISVVASNADNKYFLKEGSFASRRTDDEDMLQYVRRLLIHPLQKLFLFI